MNVASIELASCSSPQVSYQRQQHEQIVFCPMTRPYAEQLAACAGLIETNTCHSPRDRCVAYAFLQVKSELCPNQIRSFGAIAVSAAINIKDTKAVLKLDIWFYTVFYYTICPYIGSMLSGLISRRQGARRRDPCFGKSHCSLKEPSHKIWSSERAGSHNPAST